MITKETEGSVAVLRMNHGKANALDLEFARELTRVFEAERETDSRAVVLTGRGGIFSAGVDLKRLSAGDVQYQDDFVPAICRAFEAVATFPKPLVVASNGHAIAGGCVILCAGDHRVMAEGRGRVGAPELLVGVPFPMSALEIIRLAIAPQYLQQVVYGGGTYSGEDLLRIGFVDEIVAQEELLERALEKAEQYGRIPTATFRTSKQQLRHSVLRASQSDLETQVHRVWRQEETRAAIDRYVKETLGG